MAEQEIDMMAYMGMKKVVVDNEDGGSDNDIVQNNLASGVTYALSASEFSNRDITYRDRNGALQYIEPGDPRYDKAQKELKPALRSELAYRQDSYLEGLAEKGKDQSMKAYSDPLPQTDPETYDPYGESLTNLGVDEQRAFERGDARSQQDYLNKQLEEPLREMKAAGEALQESVDAQKRFESGETDVKTLQDRLLLGQRQGALRRKERELQQIRSGLLVEEYTEDPSRAKQTIGGYLSELTEKRIPKLEKEVSILEATLKEPSIYMPEQAAASGTLPGTRASREAERRRRRDDLQEQLQKKKDELFGARIDANKYGGQIGSLPETVPLQDYEKEDISKLGPYEMRESKVDIDEARYASQYAPNIEGDPNGLPIQNWWETQEPLSPSDLPRYHGGTAPDPELDALKGQYGELNVDYADLPRDYSLPTASDLNQAGDLSPGQTKDDELLKNSLTPSTTVLDTSKQDAAASTTDTGRPSIRTRF